MVIYGLLHFAGAAWTGQIYGGLSLQGRISMVDSPRVVVGAVLKVHEASNNTNDVTGERDSFKHNLAVLGKQVAVGCSSDVIPAAKSMSSVVVIVPKSGTSLWADLWAIPAAVDSSQRTFPINPSVNKSFLFKLLEH
ncbi:hypothetical protein L6164_027475 [Bauhinia variegata]|uniref:Uncharacterized protein n=1 Tax=Bauhinia variegata TaxID=167791 RepID=A0ACB9LUN8_BAUVA|nr:hypothetical protein L6164_027475 [Bauhinia variegata]